MTDDFPQTMEALRAAHAAAMQRLIEAQDSYVAALARGATVTDAARQSGLDDARRNEAAWRNALRNADQ